MALYKTAIDANILPMLTKKKAVTDANNWPIPMLCLLPMLTKCQSKLFKRLSRKKLLKKKICQQ